MDVIKSNFKENAENKLTNKKRPLSLKYVFYWKTNEDPFDQTKEAIWKEYDQNNQIHLNEKYEVFLRDNDNFKILLLPPSHIYLVNLLENYQEIIQLNKRKRLILPNKKNLFFWKSNTDPWNLREKSLWTLYDLEDQIFLNKTYNYFLNNPELSESNLITIPNFFIRFNKMLQINKYQSSRVRQIDLTIPSLISNIFRANRFDNENPSFIT